jgi:hypothetical protein
MGMRVTGCIPFSVGVAGCLPYSFGVADYLLYSVGVAGCLPYSVGVANYLPYSVGVAGCLHRLSTLFCGCGRLSTLFCGCDRLFTLLSLRQITYLILWMWQVANGCHGKDGPVVGHQVQHPDIRVTLTTIPSGPFLSC